MGKNYRREGTSRRDPSANLINEEESLRSLRSLDSYFKELVDRGYYVRFNVDLQGASGSVHRLEILCESPRERIVGLRVEGNPKLEGNDEENASTNLVIAISAIAFDLKAKPCLIVKNRIGRVARELAERNNVLLLRD